MPNPEIRSNFLVVQTFNPFLTGVTPMTPELFKKGMLHFKYLLRLAAVAMFFKDASKYEEYLNEL